MISIRMAMALCLLLPISCRAKGGSANDSLHGALDSGPVSREGRPPEPILVEAGAEIQPIACGQDEDQDVVRCESAEEWIGLDVGDENSQSGHSVMWGVLRQGQNWEPRRDITIEVPKGWIGTLKILVATASGKHTIEIKREIGESALASTIRASSADSPAVSLVPVPDAILRQLSWQPVPGDCRGATLVEGTRKWKSLGSFLASQQRDATSSEFNCQRDSTDSWDCGLMLTRNECDGAEGDGCDRSFDLRLTLQANGHVLQGSPHCVMFF